MIGDTCTCEKNVLAVTYTDTKFGSHEQRMNESWRCTKIKMLSAKCSITRLDEFGFKNVKSYATLFILLKYLLPIL